MNEMLKKTHPLLVFFLGYAAFDLSSSIRFLGVFSETKFWLIFFHILSIVMLMTLCFLIVVYFKNKYSLDEFLVVATQEKNICATVIGLVFVSFVVIINLAQFWSTISDYHLFVLKINDLSKLNFTPFIPTFNFFIKSLIFVPIAEEILFRGILQKYLANIMKKQHVLVPVAIASIAFAIVHWRFADIPYLFLCGILYGCIYYKTKKIIFPIVAHACWNLMNVLFATDLQPMGRDNSLAFFIFMIAFVILASRLYRYKKS